MIRYSIPNSEDVIVLSDHVVAHFERHRQLDLHANESGGQLFARFSGEATLVQRVTGPRKVDRSGRFMFFPHRGAERREIGRLWRLGFHYVGDWHTHPQRYPQPSPRDIMNLREAFSMSVHQLAGFLLVIVGTAQGSAGLSVSVVDDTNCRLLVPHRDWPRHRRLSRRLGPVPASD